MFAPWTTEGGWAAQGKSLCRDWSYARCRGASLPDPVTGARAHQASLSPWMALLCLVSQKNWLGFQDSVRSLDWGKSWGMYSVEKQGKAPVWRITSPWAGFMLPWNTWVCLRIIWISVYCVSVHSVSVLFGQRLFIGASYVHSLLAPSWNPTFSQEILLI